MGKVVDFEGSNENFRGEENINDARAFRNRQCVVVLWELTDEELAEVVKTKKVWTMQFFGGQLVPHFITGKREDMREMIADYGGAF